MTRFWRLVVDFLLAFLESLGATMERRQKDVDAGAERQRVEQAEEDAREEARARILAKELRELEDEELRRRGDRWAGT